jgi:antitoxin (DNA-binding transcriptional repressor) of toxin-antitoxin stability system
VTKTVSATVAARHFREILNEVERARETFQVERHGRPVASIGPAEGTARPRVVWKDALALLANGPSADPYFAADLDRLTGQVDSLPADPWARSSTAQS